MMDPREINVAATQDQVYALLGEYVMQCRLMQSLIAQSPELIERFRVDQPEAPVPPIEEAAVPPPTPMKPAPASGEARPTRRAKSAPDDAGGDDGNPG